MNSLAGRNSTIPSLVPLRGPPSPISGRGYLSKEIPALSLRERGTAKRWVRAFRHDWKPYAFANYSHFMNNPSWLKPPDENHQSQPHRHHVVSGPHARAAAPVPRYERPARHDNLHTSHGSAGRRSPYPAGAVVGRIQ